MEELTSKYQSNKLEFIKNPVVTEFLGLSQNTDFTETDLEKSIITNIQKFLMELGKGYALLQDNNIFIQKNGTIILIYFSIIII